MYKAIVLILIAVLLGVVGQINLKQGMTIVTNQIKSESGSMQNQSENENLSVSELVKKNIWLLFRALLNIKIIIGIACYGFSMLFWLLTLSKVDLSFAYPMLGMSYIMVVLSAKMFLGEEVSATRWAGTIIISLGVFLVAR